MTTTNTTTIRATVTPYEGEDFPEAAYYCEWIADCLAEIYPGADIEVSEGSRNALWVDGEPDRETAQEFGAEMWNRFCDGGYKTYSA